MPTDTTRTVVASPLCDAMNGAGAWEKLHSTGGQSKWLHRADEVIHELARRAYMVVAIEETDDGR